MNNIVLVTIDSLRADHCGFLGGPPPIGVRNQNRFGSLTPTLDSLATESVVYEAAISPGPRTPSSMPVIFTGEHLDAGNKEVYHSWDEKRKRWRERRERIRRHLTRYQTLAERLAERGYATAAITANPWTARDTGFDRGFDHFHAVDDKDSSSWLGRLLKRTTGLEADWLLCWPDFYEHILESQRKLDAPYFLWIFLLDPHQPYLTPRQYRQENTAPEMYYANLRYNRSYRYTDVLPAHLDYRLRRAYRDTVRSIDGFFERLCEDFESDDPTFVVHGDHGEAFGEHGTYGHRLQLYEENVRVPLLVSGTEHTSRIAEPVPLQDLPRMLESVADNTFAPRDFTSQFVVSRTEEDERVSVRGEAWKYLQGGENWAYVLGGEGEELYYLPDDQSERRNRIEAVPEAKRMVQWLFDQHEESRIERERIARAVDSIVRTM